MALDILSDAINDKHIVEFTYNGHPRSVEPHAIGVMDGVPQLLGYQIGGSSSSGGELPKWNRFTLKNISALKITDQTFAGPRPLVSEEHTVWDREIVTVEA